MKKEKTQAELAQAKYQARIRRWKAPGTAKVSHAGHRTVIVPSSSKLSAVMCAAELWGVDWYDVIHAEVHAVPPGTRRESIPKKE